MKKVLILLTVLVLTISSNIGFASNVFEPDKEIIAIDYDVEIQAAVISISDDVATLDFVDLNLDSSFTKQGLVLECFINDTAYFDDHPSVLESSDNYKDNIYSNEPINDIRKNWIRIE